MKIVVRSVNLQLDAGTRSDVERRIHGGLAKLSFHIVKAKVRVADKKGPRAPVASRPDRRCTRDA